MITKDDKDAQIEYLKSQLQYIKQNVKQLIHIEFFDQDDIDIDCCTLNSNDLEDFIDKTLFEVTY